jgi:hypothetical protein
MEAPSYVKSARLKEWVERMAEHWEYGGESPEYYR